MLVAWKLDRGTGSWVERCPEFGDLQRRLHIGDKAVLPDVVEGHGHAVFLGVLGLA